VEGLDADKLLLATFRGHEAMSRLFSFNLELLMVATDPETQEASAPVQFEDVIGKNATISVMLSDNTQRYFNGIVSQFAFTAVDQEFVHYEMEVVPWTWLLTRYADCKIFHNKTVGDIIQQVFSDRGQTDFKVSLTAAYSPLEYCVQYRETDFNFISRLMEQFGIFYFFQHEDGKHTMVIADSSSAYEDCWPDNSSFGFDLAAGGLDSDDVVTAWSTEVQLKSGTCTLADYNFQTPAASLVNQDPTLYAIGGNSGFELFDYPGLYINNSDGKTMAKLRMEEVEAGHLIGRGSGVCRAFTSGTKFTLTAHPQEVLNGVYLITEVQHSASVAGDYTASGDAGEYSNHFSCIPEDVVFRPARITPKPFVQGPQTAVVTGTNPDSGSTTGEEIWVDKYGRVVVLFPWDRKGACSCWVRVSQDWAGQGWGAITIPRVGQEVIVSFLEGDPDRPIITGRVYNATQVVPYALPANQTRSTFMTRSSKGGSASTYNELRFEDLSGKEQVFLRAQFDYDTQVLHDSREAIGNQRSLTVTKNQLESVGGDLHSTVTGGVFESVGKDVNTNVSGKIVENVAGDVNTKVGGNQIEQVVANVNRTIGGNYVETVSGDSNSNVSGNTNQKIGSNLSIQVGENLYEKSGQNYAHQAGTMIHLKGGMQVVIEAGTMLTLMVGGNSVVINSSGVSITGTMVMINSGGGAGSGCGSSPTSPTSPSSPATPVAPTAPDKADDGKTGTKLGSGSDAPAAAVSSDSASPASASQIADPKLVAGPAADFLGGAAAGAAGAAGGAAAGAASQAEQAAQQATQAAAQGAQQAANAAQQAATEAQQAAQQAEQQAQAAVQQATDQARQAYQQAQQAVQQAEQAVNQAVGQAKVAAEQALAQAQAEAMQAAQAANQAVQDAKAKAAQVEQQAQAAAAQAQQAAQAAAAQAQAAAQQVQQQAQQAAQQGEQAAQQAQQAAQQAQQQAQQAAQQAQQAAAQAQKQAQQAAQQVTQAASGAQQQAQQAAQAAQQSASQAVSQATKGV
jgi:type VI secretion system secreted protein VgrG